ncbi:hypothetical protein ACFQZF_03575 [Flavobacterium myungsuense]|uniref:PKD domain-containing protein n=1 Tax=Flavobacterium myungsuense TaxID=651823 RepID=A0ABW3J5S0_9FLAO
MKGLISFFSIRNKRLFIFLTIFIISCSKDTICKLPTPVVTSNSPVNIGYPINLETPEMTGYSYYWTGPAGFISEERNPVINYASSFTSGSYNLTVKKEDCTVDPVSLNVIVNPILNPCNNQWTNYFGGFNGSLSGSVLNAYLSSEGQTLYVNFDSKGNRIPGQMTMYFTVNSTNAGIYTTGVDCGVSLQNDGSCGRNIDKGQSVFVDYNSDGKMVVSFCNLLGTYSCASINYRIPISVSGTITEF